MTSLGDAIRSNADLHRALHRIIAELACARRNYYRVANLPALCELAAAALPHIPPPPKEDEP